MDSYINTTGGYLIESNATTACRFCSASNTNTYLTQLNSSYDTRWRNFGVMWAFIIFNICMAMFLYWWARVPRKQEVREEAPPPPEELSRQTTRNKNVLGKMQSGLSKVQSRGARKSEEARQSGETGKEGEKA